MKDAPLQLGWGAANLSAQIAQDFPCPTRCGGPRMKLHRENAARRIFDRRERIPRGAGPVKARRKLQHMIAMAHRSSAVSGSGGKAQTIAHSGRLGVFAGAQPAPRVRRACGQSTAARSKSPAPERPREHRRIAGRRARVVHRTRPAGKHDPAGSNLRICASEALQGRIAENTFCSRMRAR